MLVLLAKAASEQTSWPDVILIIAVLVFFAFIIWILSRGTR